MGQCEQHLCYPGWGVQPVTVERALSWSLPQHHPVLPCLGSVARLCDACVPLIVSKTGTRARKLFQIHAHNKCITYFSDPSVI